ncbi:MAG: DMT family transporter [Betaproteobacteria bacterium]|nr:DMT family transporter [Betaproteobacteria bacterium]
MSTRLQYSPVRAVLCMGAGTALVAGTDIVMKHLSADHSLPAILWVRNLMIMLVMYGLLRHGGEWRDVRTSWTRMHVLRGLAMGIAPILYFIALMDMPVAELTAINLTMPLVMALLAVPMLKEPLDPRRITAVLLGFVGVLAITRPGSDAFTPAMLLGLAAAFSGAVFQLLTRKVAGAQGAMASLFYPWAIATVICTPFAFWRWTPPVTAFEWLLVALVTVLSLGGNTLMVRSYQYGPASLIAPFIYLHLVWAALFGWLIFSAFPDGWSLAGMIMIVAGGLVLVPRRILSRTD